MSENLKQRVGDKARAAARFAKIEECDDLGRARLFTIPGSEGKQYHVEMVRLDAYPMILTYCYLDTDQACLGNTTHAGASGVCYHSLAALVKAAQNARREIVFCETEQDAKCLERLGYRIVAVRPGHGTGKGLVWAASRPKSNGKARHAS